MKHLSRWTLLFLICTLLAGCVSAPISPVPTPAVTPEQPAVAPTAVAAQGEVLQAHFIDVGQGDGILLRMGEQAWVIDAGTNAAAPRMVQYLQDQGVDKIDYVVGTHPHEDHIGGLDNVITTFNVQQVMMPKITHTTKTFEDVVDAISNKKLRITTPTVGDTYTLGQAQIQVLGPGEGPYTDLNDASVVLRVTYGQISLLLMGDAEKASEQRILQTGLPVAAQVLKAGHHGSSTSSSDAFLDAVSPQDAVLSLAADNTYGHPHREVVKALKDRGIRMLRTDELGDIVMFTDGSTVWWETSKGDPAPSASPAAQKQAYIGNRNSQVFHVDSCTSLPAKKNRISFDTRAQAVEQGFRACTLCNP